MKRPAPQEIYRHFKGNLYQVLTIAKDCETTEEMVVYQALYSPYGVWVRSLRDFTAELDKTKYKDAKQKYRFERVMPEEADAVKKTEKVESAEVSSPEEKEHCSAMEEEFHLDPLVEEFMDAPSAAQRLAILETLRTRVTNDMIDIMAIAAGIEIGPGSVEERFLDLRECLETVRHYEQSRH